MDSQMRTWAKEEKELEWKRVKTERKIARELEASTEGQEVR